MAHDVSRQRVCGIQDKPVVVILLERLGLCRGRGSGAWRVLASDGGHCRRVSETSVQAPDPFCDELPQQAAIKHVCAWV